MKKSFIAYAATLMMLVLSRPVFAYIDPAVGSYIIQIVAGVLIAAGAVLAIFWNKIKTSLQNKKYAAIGKNLKTEADDDDEDDWEPDVTGNADQGKK